MNNHFFTGTMHYNFRLNFTVQECHNNLYGPQGSFTSPQYPEFYPPNAYCPTRITANADHRILVQFLDVDLEPDNSIGCAGNFDIISIYDSYKADEDKFIDQICGPDPPQTAYVSSGDSLFVPFKSDPSYQSRGFQAVFYTFPGTVYTVS